MNNQRQHKTPPPHKKRTKNKNKTLKICLKPAWKTWYESTLQPKTGFRLREHKKKVKFHQLCWRELLKKGRNVSSCHSSQSNPANSFRFMLKRTKTREITIGKEVKSEEHFTRKNKQKWLKGLKVIEFNDKLGRFYRIPTRLFLVEWYYVLL